MHPTDGVVPRNVGEADGRPSGVAGGGVRLRGEVDPLAFPCSCLVADRLQQVLGDALTAALGVGYDVLHVDVVRIVLAPERNCSATTCSSTTATGHVEENSRA